MITSNPYNWNGEVDCHDHEEWSERPVEDVSLRIFWSENSDDNNRDDRCEDQSSAEPVGSIGNALNSDGE